MSEFAVTVIGRDRPGIIADVTEALAGLGLNLTDSTMTRLRGNFAMTLICASNGERGSRRRMGEERAGAGPRGEPGPPGPAQVEAALAELTGSGELLATVRAVDGRAEPEPGGGHYLLSLHGADRLGIVASVTRVIADAGGNVTDLSTRLTGDLYVLAAEVDLPATVDMVELGHRLQGVAAALGVGVTLRTAEADVL